ncbi:chondroitinase-B domain-containing protein [uncultured Alistipes sp.]|jgi:tonB-dependent receptor|uniref:chondroitinase-B domain-containing protein n=1 Tax=uncultured Alistipes sp. TaxID=538949 RepID=UPI0025CC41DE|nr:chondroitinase-B domain-containing protein [uncultured Alistipes sp.]
MQNLKPILLTLLLLLTGSALAREYRVPLGGVAAALKQAEPGDRIVIENGIYRDAELKWRGTGVEGKPVVIEAATPGGVVVEGASSLRFAGEWLEIRGLHFQGGDTPSGAVIEFRYGGDVANNCRLTECVVDGYNPARRDIAYSYILVFGRHNRVDHCSLTGKLNLGVTLIVMLNEERSLENFHSIDHNHFGPRPVYGSNGAETIRVGTSQQAYSSSNTLIEENLFDRCNGEVEVVSIKSSDNVIRRNVFWESQGVLALRHGDRNRAEENLFVGNGIRNTGGIRIVNAGHKVIGNSMWGIAGGRFFSALAVMNAVPNSLPNRYCLVEDVDITNNIFVDCANIEFGTGRDLERTLAPERVLFANNTIVNHKLTEPFVVIDRTDGFTFRDNRVDLAVKYEATGFESAKMKLKALPSEQEIRAGKGASWYKPQARTAAASDKVYTVRAGEDLPNVVARAEAGAVVELSDAGGDYAIDRALMIRVPLTIRAAKGTSRPVIRFNGRKGDNMITIADGGELHIEGVAFCGDQQEGMALARAGIATAPEMIRPYNLYVDNCEFYNFGESGFFAVKGSASTFAERVEIRRSLFRNLSGDGISFAAERDDKGRYNAEDILIEDCSFFRMLGLPIDIYRGGSDESTAGPYVTIRSCNFEDCCNKERGSAVRLIGPQVLDITGCNFSNSGRGGAAIRLDEATWEKVSIADCNLWNAGRIVSMTGNAVKGEIHHIEPVYTDAEAFDFSQQAQSRLADLGIGVKK